MQLENIPAFCIYNWGKYLACFESIWNVSRAKSAFDCWVFIFCLQSFPHKNTWTHWKTLLFLHSICAVTNRREWKHMWLLVVLEHPFLQLFFCLVLEASIYNTIFDLNSNHFLLFFADLLIRLLIFQFPREGKWVIFPSRPCSSLSRAAMVIEWVD